jgi:hypothetical protein
MAIFARGIERQFVLARETEEGVVAPGPGRLLRRVQFPIDPAKEMYESQEVLATQQARDARHGVSRVAGQLTGELSVGSYKPMFEAILRRDFTDGATSGAIIDVTAASGPPGTFTRGSGSWLDDGFKVGDVVRCTGWTAHAAANNNRNYRIIGLTSTMMMVGEAVAAKAAGDTVTFAAPGQKTFIPQSDHTAHSHTLEVWDPAISVSRRFFGLKFGQTDFAMPPTGMVTFAAAVSGLSYARHNTQLYLAPEPTSTGPSLAAVSGAVRFGGVDVALVTGMTVSIVAELFGSPVIGSNFIPTLIPGRVRVRGNLTGYMTDADFLAPFENETEVDIHVMLTASSLPNAEFIAFNLDRVKIAGGNTSDGEREIMHSFTFVGLENVAGGAGQATEATTISIQDSST